MELEVPRRAANFQAMGVIVFLIMGLVVGFLARALTPGPDKMGWGMTLLLGIVGSFVGWGIGRLVGLYHTGFHVIRPAGFLMSLLGAILLLLATRGARRKRMVS
jgi:uncharacterized membrane protein YeaQ/YmgE (transglycosylase-associated protein family)